MGYYFISIGGSGAKALEALTHLCIAGLLPAKDSLSVLAIDPDTGNGNLERSSSSLNHFKVFQTLDVGNDTPLFQNKVALIEPFPWNPTEHDKTLDDLMRYTTYSGTPIGNLYEVLYTNKERHTILNEGFRGHPSIGAAVLAKKYTSDQGDAQWANFMQRIDQSKGNAEDIKIFLTGSVFGGTGAAGIPTLSRLLRDSLTNKNFAIGGALVLPYFNFVAPKDDSKLFARSENFLTNTKAALKYYSQKDNVFDAMYFIGDNTRKVEEFSVGAGSQRNDAHLVNFYSALAAIDFFGENFNGQHIFKYICHGDDSKFDWSDFQIANLNKKFVQFVRFIFAYIHLVKPVLKGLVEGKIPNYQYPWFVDLLQGVSVNTPEVANFNDYTESFITWLKQLETSSMGREVLLIKQNMFEISPARLSKPEAFNSCDGTLNKNLTIHEIWCRLSETPKDTAGNGFGRFLRRLYDVCDVDLKV